MKLAIGVFALALLVLAAACSQKPGPYLTGVEQRTTALESHVAQLSDNLYRPRLRNLMSNIDQAYVNIWFAMSAKNWQAADYALAALRDEASMVARYYPALPQAVEPMSQAIDANLTPALDELQSAIRRTNIIVARVAFKKMTNGCNACHKKSDKPYLKVQEPRRYGASSLDFRR